MSTDPSAPASPRVHSPEMQEKVDRLLPLPANQGPTEMVRLKQNIGLIRTSMRRGWKIPDDLRDAIRDRLAEIVRTTDFTLDTLVDGEVQPVSRPEIANAQSIAAARVLVEMDKIDQTDYWNHDKNERLDAGAATERFGGVEIVVPGRPPPLPEGDDTPAEGA